VIISTIQDHPHPIYFSSHSALVTFYRFPSSTFDLLQSTPPCLIHVLTVTSAPTTIQHYKYSTTNLTFALSATSAQSSRSALPITRSPQRSTSKPSDKQLRVQRTPIQPSQPTVQNQTPTIRWPSPTPIFQTLSVQDLNTKSDTSHPQCQLQPPVTFFQTSFTV
jgi:hypothetical protein